MDLSALTQLFGGGGANNPGSSVASDPNSMKILGMNPANFAAVLGLLGQAIAPKGSPVGNVGGVASMFGQRKLTADAAGIQDAKNKAFMKEIIASMNKPGGLSSDSALSLLNKSHTPVEESLLDNTPASFYGTAGGSGSITF